MIIYHNFVIKRKHCRHLGDTHWYATKRVVHCSGWYGNLNGKPMFSMVNLGTRFTKLVSVNIRVYLQREARTGDVIIG